MKVQFKATTRTGDVICSNCIIQKYINQELIIYLGISGKWKLIKNETLTIEML
jgi:hypothetical protein